MEQLRFKNSSGIEFPEPEEIVLGDIAERIRRKASPDSTAPVMMISAGQGFIYQHDRYSRDNAGTSLKNYTLLKKGELAYNHGYSKIRNFGSCFVLKTEDEARVPYVYHTFRLPEDNPYYFGEYLNCGLYDSILKGLVSSSVRMDGLLNISYDDYMSLNIRRPSKEEQDKVAAFLSLYDKKIENQMAKVEALETRRKGLLQQIFSQEIRFKADDGSEFPDWDTEELNTYLYENKERNKENKFRKEDVLSVSKDYGVINQIKYQGRSLAGEDVSNYHIVHEGNVVYTKSPLGKQPYGIIKASTTEGIVSTLYAVYYCRENVLPKLIDYYFSLDETLNRYLKPLVNIGAKHDMKVNNTDALAGLVTLPSSLDEQQKIVNFFELISKEIQIEKDKLEAIKQVKKGLLQQMFV